MPLDFRYVAPGAVSIGKIPPPSDIISNPTSFQKFQCAPFLGSQLPMPVTSLRDSNPPGLAACFSVVQDIVHTAHKHSEIEAMNSTVRSLNPAAITGQPSCSSTLSVSRRDACSPDFSLDRYSSGHSLASRTLSSQLLKSKTRAWSSFNTSKQTAIEISSDDGPLKQTTHRAGTHPLLLPSSEQLAVPSARRPSDAAKPSSSQYATPRTSSPDTLQSHALQKALSNPHLAPEILAGSPTAHAVISSSDEHRDPTSRDSLPKATNVIVTPSNYRPACLPYRRRSSSHGRGEIARASHSTIDSTERPSTSLASALQSQTVGRVASTSVSIASSLSPSAAQMSDRTLSAGVHRLNRNLSPRVVAHEASLSIASQGQSSSQLAIANTASPRGPTRPEKQLKPAGDQAGDSVPMRLHVAGSDRHSSLSISNTSFLAVVVPLIPRDTPPPHSRTSKEVLVESNKRVSAEWSSPLPSLTSEDDSSEEQAKEPKDIQSQPSKLPGQTWTKALWKSFTDTKLEQAPKYPAVGQQFESLEAFKRACLLASWPRGHHMHIRSSQKSGSTLKHVLSCFKDRAPPKGCNCTFRIAAIWDKSLKNPAWIVTHVVPQHHNHTPEAGGIKSLPGNSTQKQSQVSGSSGRRQSGRRSTSISNQADEIIPVQTASDVIVNSDASPNRRTRFSLSNESAFAKVTPLIPCKTPPPIQLGTRTEVSGDLNPVSSWPLDWSSPLTSLASDDDTSEEVEKVNEIQSRRPQTNGYQWTKLLWKSYANTVLDQAPEYPAIGQQFTSLEAFKEACLLASWTRGHTMFPFTYLSTSGPHKNQARFSSLSYLVHRAPPKGCNCTFRIAATFDQSLKNSAWIVTHVFLQHRNHNPRSGDIEETQHNSTHKQSQPRCSSGRRHTVKPTLCSHPPDKKEDKSKSGKDLEEDNQRSLLERKESTQSTPHSVEKSSDSRVAEPTPRTRSSTSKSSETSIISLVGLRSSKRKRGGSDDTNSHKQSITSKHRR
ncbi:hypothetical protein DFH28DRAFT_1132194 [Melampsora americana]|nr:hypothetical protein DFH28DRAFT_1132194 [Melampsora americana]